MYCLARWQPIQLSQALPVDYKHPFGCHACTRFGAEPDGKTVKELLISQMPKMLGDAALWQAVLRNCMQADITSECLKPDPIGYDKP